MNETHKIRLIDEMLVVAIIGLLETRQYPDDMPPILRERLAFLHEARLNLEEKTQDLERIITEMADDQSLKGYFLAEMLMSLYWYYAGNAERAAYYAAVAYLGFYPSPIAKLMLLCSLQPLGAIETADEYIEMVAWKSPVEIAMEYRDLAAESLVRGNMAYFDHYLIRRLAIMHQESKMHYIGECRAKRLEMGRDETVRLWREHINERFVHENEEQANKNIDKWSHQRNKIHIANYVSNFLCNVIYRKSPSLVDFGCHAGTLGSMILDYSEKTIAYLGIDHDPVPIETARKTYPEREFYLGGVEKLLELDRETTVLLASFVCCLLSPEDLEAVVEYAHRRAKYVVLVEDASNMYGDDIVFRRHYLLHPYDAVFKKYGFGLLHKELLINPNQAANTILTYKNRGKE